VNTIGSFLQHDWKSQKLNLSLGLRYDFYLVRDLDLQATESMSDVTNGVLAPRINFLYKLNPDLKFRSGYAKGYRAPQIFNEDFHVDLVNATRVVHLNDNDLVQETSHSFSSSLSYDFLMGNTVNDILIEGFYTRLLNPFADEYYPIDTSGNFAYMRVNAKGGAFVTGINLEWNSRISKKINLQSGFTLQKSQFQKPQSWGNEEGSVSANFMRTPDRYGFATLNWNAVKKLRTSLSFNYTGPMDVPHFGLVADDFTDTDEYQPISDAIKHGDIIEGERLERSEDFFITDLLISYDILLMKGSTIQLYAGIKNIFNQTQREYDRGVYRDSGYIYGPYQPRTINFGIKMGNLNSR